MTAFIISVVVALLGTALFALSSRYEGAHSAAEIETPVYKFVTSATNYLLYGSTGEYGSATGEESKWLNHYINDIKSGRDNIRSLSKDSPSDGLTYALLMFPFNTFVLVGWSLEKSSGVAFAYTVLTYILAALFVKMYSHTKTVAREIQEENAYFDKVKDELSALESKSDFQSLQERYHKLTDLINCSVRLSYFHSKSRFYINIAGVISLISLVVVAFATV